MKLITTIQSDLEVTPLGTNSRLAESLHGTPILRRTIERVTATQGVERIFVLCPAAQLDFTTALLEGTSATIRPHHAGSPPWGALVQTARKWSLDGWRGGIGGATCFDEFVDCRLLNGLLRAEPADAVLCAPAAAPLLDPGLASRMIEHHAGTGDDSRLTFTTAPPGLAGIILDASLIHELAEKNIPIGWVFSYKPDNPQKDLVFQPCCCDVPAELRHATGRLLADTRRSIERIERLSEPDDGEPRREQATTRHVGRWLEEDDRTHIEPMPREVEIELTTDDPYPDAVLHPRGSRVPARGPIDPVIVDQIARELARYDDSLIVLGGFGDPLRHPQFEPILANLAASQRECGSPYGLAVRTTAVDLTDAIIDAVITHEVDVLNVVLDAWTPELYAELHSPGHAETADLSAVLQRIDHFTQVREQRKSVKPILVPELTKARNNVHELDDFHDGWIRRAGSVCITGYSDRAGQCEDRSAMPVAPLPRTPCRRLRTRCLVLADGRVTLCDQDFRGLLCVGRIGEHSLQRLWRGEPEASARAAFPVDYRRIRDAHAAGRFDVNALCAACTEWHRP